MLLRSTNSLGGWGVLSIAIFGLSLDQATSTSLATLFLDTTETVQWVPFAGVQGRREDPTNCAVLQAITTWT
ncbi:hypothetical protein PSPO01_09463 [Paraphaeosphaeria sporulosa]